MLTFPLPAPLKNSFVLVRAGECLADLHHEIQTNPVKKLRTDNALSEEGTVCLVSSFLALFYLTSPRHLLFSHQVKNQCEKFSDMNSVSLSQFFH